MTEEKSFKIGVMIKPLVWGVVSCSISISLLFIITGLVISNFNVPVPSISTIILVCAGISAFIGGFIAAKIRRRQGLIVGLISGLIFVAVIIMCALLGTGSLFSVDSLIKYVVIITAAMIGGSFGVNHKPKTRR